MIRQTPNQIDSVRQAVCGEVDVTQSPRSHPFLPMASSGRYLFGIPSLSQLLLLSQVWTAPGIPGDSTYEKTPLHVRSTRMVILLEKERDLIIIIIFRKQGSVGLTHAHAHANADNHVIKARWKGQIIQEQL